MALTNYDVHMRVPRPHDPRPHIAHPDNPGCVHMTGTGRRCGFPSVVRDKDGPHCPAHGPVSGHLEILPRSPEYIAMYGNT